MLIYQVIIAVLVAFLYLILVAQSGKIKILKEANINLNVAHDKVFTEIFKKIKKLNDKTYELDQSIFVMVDSDSGVRFQERVPISTIMGLLMSEMGLTIKSNVLKITKSKGDISYGKERKETKRSQSKEKES